MSEQIGLVEKVRRHYRWGREQGFGRLVEEDQLNPFERARTAAAKGAWRRRHGVPAGTATMVLAVGLQRSGTNMLVRGLEQAPEVEVHNENDRAAFTSFRLRPDPVVRDLVQRSRHAFVLFKPLCDSHRTVDLLGLLPPGRARAVWIYRGVDGRARSAVAKFGPANLQALTELAAGRGTDRWEAGGLTAEDLELVRSLDAPGLDPHSAAALFWYLRNGLYFRLGLDRDPRVSLACYDRFLADPPQAMQGLCDRLGFRYRPDLVAGIEPGRSTARPLELDPRVRALCDQRADQLAAAYATQYGEPAT